MIQRYTEEFISIVRRLKKGEKARKIGNYLAIDKEILSTLLKKYAYETADNKLKVWKGLNWIDTDENRLTKRVMDSKNGKQIPLVKISLTVYETLKMINGK